MSADLTTTRARAWAVTRKDGLVLGFTDHDAGLEFEGIAFRPRAGMAAGVLNQGTGLAVDNGEAVGVLSDDAIAEADLRAGRWDGAEIRLWEVDWTAPEARKLLFRGNLGEVTTSGASFRAELRGLTEALNHPRGRVYHPRCAAVLGDRACGVDLTRPGFMAEGVIRQVISPGEWIVEGIEAQDPGWFTHGRVVIRSGEAVGLASGVRQDAVLADGARRVSLWQAPGLVPVAGDAVQMVAGCDKAGATCRLKFGNYLNFRGFPHLPPEDWLLAPTVARAVEGKRTRVEWSSGASGSGGGAEGSAGPGGSGWGGGA